MGVRNQALGQRRLGLEQPVVVAGDNYLVGVRQPAQPLVELYDLFGAPGHRRIAGVDEDVTGRDFKPVVSRVRVADADDAHE